jgi:hypothetical protein
MYERERFLSHCVDPRTFLKRQAQAGRIGWPSAERVMQTWPDLFPYAVLAAGMYPSPGRLHNLRHKQGCHMSGSRGGGLCPSGLGGVGDMEKLPCMIS